MKNTTFSFLIALSVLCGFNFSLATSHHGQLDSFLNLMASEDRLMGSLTLSREGETTYQWSAGTAYHQLKEVRDLTADHVNSVGSVTQMITATAILQLAEKGILSLEATLDQFFPQIKGSEKIEIRHLLSHRSGIKNFTNDPDYPYFKHRDLSRAEMLKLLSSYEVAFEPGTDWGYSNSNYLLLGYIAEMVTYKDFGQWVEKNIFSPLEMTHTFMSFHDIPEEKKTHSFIKTYDDWATYTPETSRAIAFTAGGLYSTGRDLNAFMHALFSGELLLESSLKWLTEGQMGYSMGLISMEFNGKTAYGQIGQIDGYHTASIYFPDQKIGMQLLLNGLNDNFRELISQLVQLTLTSTQASKEYSRLEKKESETTNASGFLPIDTGKKTGIRDQQDG